MGLDRVGDRLALAVAARHRGADLGVGALDLVADGLADVVQERRPLGRLDRDAELGGDRAGDLRRLDQVVEHVLAVGGPEAQPAEHLEQLRIDPVDPGLELGALALGDHRRLDVRLRLLVDLLDRRRLDPAVGDQPLERQPGDLAADAVEAREDDGVRRLVDDHVDAGQRLEGADVAALAADDPALHLLARQLDQPGRRLAGVRAGEPAHRDREDVARPAVGLALRLLLDLDQGPAGLVARVVLDVGDQQLLGLGGRQPREALELLALHLLLPLQLLGLAVEVALAVLERLLAPLDVGELQPCLLGVVEGALLQPGDLLAARLQVGRLRLASLPPRRSAPRRSPVVPARRSTASDLPRRSRLASFLLPRRSITMTMVERRRPSGPRQAPATRFWRRRGSRRRRARTRSPAGSGTRGPVPAPVRQRGPRRAIGQFGRPVELGLVRLGAGALARPRPIPRSTSAASIRSAPQPERSRLSWRRRRRSARRRARRSRSARRSTSSARSVGTSALDQPGMQLRRRPLTALQGPEGLVERRIEGSDPRRRSGTAETAYAASGSDAGASGAGASGGAAISWAGVRVGPGARVTPRAS